MGKVLQGWGGVCCYHPVPLQGSPLTARKIQGFVLKIKEKVQTIKSSELYPAHAPGATPALGGCAHPGPQLGPGVHQELLLPAQIT